MKDAPIESCEQCVFFRPVSIIEAGRAGTGFCRRFPPRGYPVGGGPNGQVGAIQVPTPTQAGDWCGEFITPEDYGDPDPTELIRN